VCEPAQARAHRALDDLADGHVLAEGPDCRVDRRLGAFVLAGPELFELLRAQRCTGVTGAVGHQRRIGVHDGHDNDPLSRTQDGDAFGGGA
jgi:hypothetical protein